MKNYRLIHAAIIGAFALFAAACEAEITSQDDIYRPVGSVIPFTAETGYDNGVVTKAEYSGELFGSSPKRERIDWKAGDAVQIAYNGTAGDFTVTGTPHTDGENSTTSFSGGLSWATAPHTFYALYPSKVNGSKAGQLTTAGKVSGTIPATQDVNPDNTITVPLDATSTNTLTKYQPDTEKYGYLVAYKRIEGSSSESVVELKFKPAVTTFEFKLKLAEGQASARVASVKLSSAAGEDGTDLTGGFSFNITGGDGYGATWDTPVITGGGREITVGFPEGGVSVPAEGYLDFSILALPIDQTGLTLTLNYTDNSHKSIKLMDGDPALGNWYTFTGGKKYVITNEYVPGELTYTLVHTGTTVTLPDGTTVVQVVTRDNETEGNTTEAPFDSYKSSDSGQTKTPVSVTFEYAAVGSDGNPVGEWSSTIPSTLNSVSAAGDSENKRLSANVTEYSDPPVKEYTSEFLEHARNLHAHSSRGSSASPHDLSMHDIHGNRRGGSGSNQPVTANSYVIDAAGSYMFPIVYGNAIDYTKTSASLYLNGVNQYAYKDSENPADFDPNTMGGNVLHHFHRFDGNVIGSPYILDDAGLSSSDVEAVIVWEDVENAEYSFIDNVTVQNVSVPGNVFYDPVGGSYKTSVPYIKFTIPRGEISADETIHPFHRVTGIRPGNALVALRLKADKTIAGQNHAAGTILWSWHIWITDGYDADGASGGDGLEPISVKNTDNVVSEIMPVYLGWCDMQTETKYHDRAWFVRVRQTEGSEEPIIFKVVQKHSDDVYRSAYTFYQWGRKDPFLPVGGPVNGVNKFHFSPAGYTITAGEQLLSGSSSFEVGLHSAIQYPYQFPTGTSTMPVNWIVPSGDSNFWFFNLWDMHSTDYSNDGEIYKTIYDPCPPEYQVPKRKAFTGFLSVPYSGGPNDMNVSGDWDNGWKFLTGFGQNTIFFPTMGGYRAINTGRPSNGNLSSVLWMSTLYQSVSADADACSFSEFSADVLHNPDEAVDTYIAQMRGIRPAKEKTAASISPSLNGHVIGGEYTINNDDYWQ